MKVKEKLKNVADSSVDATKKVVGYEDAKQLFNVIKDMAAVSLNPFRKIESRNETFEQAMIRFKCTESDIAEAFKMCKVNFYVNAALASLLIVYCFYMLFAVQAVFPALGALAITFMNFALMFKYSFRAYQIKHRKLCPISEYLKNSNEWIL